MKALDKTSHNTKRTQTIYYPPELKEEMYQLDTAIYHGLSNGAYKAGFAQSQEAYDLAVQKVFETLDTLEERLSDNRYLLGSTITASDWKLNDPRQSRGLKRVSPLKGQIGNR